jgi:hypothetical protein
LPNDNLKREISSTIKRLDAYVEKWCYDNNYQQILDIDIKKQKFHDKEKSKYTDLLLDMKESLQEAQNSQDEL